MGNPIILFTIDINNPKQFLKVRRILPILSLLIVLLSCENSVDSMNEPFSKEAPLVDIEGNVYQTMRIGTQVWMAENLKTTRYIDGKPIRFQKDCARDTCQNGGYCYYNNTTDSEFISKQGALYDWHAASSNKLAPIGWRIPTESDWATLWSFTYNEMCDNGEFILPEFTTGWGGYRSAEGQFYGVYIPDYFSVWWSSTSLDDKSAYGVYEGGYFRVETINGVRVPKTDYIYNKHCYLSVRLIKE
jgi:uncharacterized protein (TIGR02145 family)